MDFGQVDLLDVLFEVRNSAIRKVKVASLGKVVEVDTSHKMFKTKLFPILKGENEKCVNVRYLNSSDEDAEDMVGQIILVLFLDKNFLSNLITQENGKDTVQELNPNLELHSENYAIAIKTF